jgi:SNF2 family DNA or RNA helicase
MIQERLARQAYLIKKVDALPDLPPKVYDIHEVEMTAEQETVYRQLCETLMAEFENMLADADGKDVLVVNNILTQMLRLAQITSGFVGIPQVVDEMGNVVQTAKINRFDPNPKIEAIVEILKEKEPEQKTIIWTNWVQNIKTLKARLDYEGIKAVTYYGDTSEADRAFAVTSFNEDPATKVLIGNPRAGGVGLNLLGHKIGGEATTYCDHVIYFSQNWSAVDRSQSEDRPHRRGTSCHVRYTDLVVPATIDEEIRCRVMDKRTSALKIQDVRAVISRIMKG